MFSCEFCEIFQNTFFYRTPPGDCFCIMHFRRCTFNLFNNPCLERKGNQWNCMFKQFVFMSIFRNISHTYIGFNIRYNLFIINFIFKLFLNLNINKIECTTPSQEFFWDISKYNFFFTSPNRIAFRNNLWTTFSVGGLCHFSSIPIKFYWFILCCTLSATFF